MEPELVEEEEKEGLSQSDSAADRAASEEDGRREGGYDAGKPSSLRVEQLSRFLRQQQEVVYKQENISKYFPSEIQKVAIKCWEQIHPNISPAIEGKYGRVLEEWSVLDKLAELDRKHSQHPTTHPAWHPTGIPVEDSLNAESEEASQVLPDFETKLAQMQAVSCDLEQRLREREEEAAKLELEITTSLDTIKQTTSQFA